MIAVIGGRRSSCVRGSYILTSPAIQIVDVSDILPLGAIVVDCGIDTAIDQLIEARFQDGNYILEHCGLGFGSRRGASKRSALFCHMLAAYRKEAPNTNIFLLCRDFEELDPRIRRVADIVFNFA